MTVTGGPVFTRSMTGAYVLLSADVAGAHGAPTGAVAFIVDGVPLPDCQSLPLVDRVATCLAWDLDAGERRLVVAYGGDATYVSAYSTPVDFHVGSPGPTVPSVDLTASPLLIAPGQPVSLSTSITGAGGVLPVGTVEYSVNGDPIPGCPVVATLGAPGQNLAVTVTCESASLPAGTHAIEARFPGMDGVYAAASDSQVIEVLRYPTTTTLTSSGNPAVAGTTVTFIAMVSDTNSTPSGSVRFLRGSAPIYGCEFVPLDLFGRAQCATYSLFNGYNDITAAYSGSTVHDTSISTILRQGIYRLAPEIVITPSQSPAPQWSWVTFTVTVRGAAGVPAGYVTVNSSLSGLLCYDYSLDAAGSARCVLAYLGVGVHSITAEFRSSSPSYANTTSAPLSMGVYVPSLPAPTMSLAPSLSPAPVGAPVEIAVTVGGPHGPAAGELALASDAGTVGGCARVPVIAGIARCIFSGLPAGVHSIRAFFRGDAAYVASWSPALSLGIYKAPPPVAMTVEPSPTSAYAWTTLRAQVLPGPLTPGVRPSGQVHFYEGSQPLCSDWLASDGSAQCSVRWSTPGSRALSAKYVPYSSTYADATSPSIAVQVTAAAKPATVTTVKSAPASATVGQPASVLFEVKALVAQGEVPTGTLNVTANGVALVPCQNLTVTNGRAACHANFARGIHSIVATYSGSEWFAGSTSAAVMIEAFHPAGSGTASMVVEAVEPAMEGSLVTVVATVAGNLDPPTGDVGFATSLALPGCQAVALAGGKAACRIAGLAAGSYGIEATYWSGGRPTASLYPIVVNSKVITVTPPGTGESSVALERESESTAYGAPVLLRAIVAGTAGNPEGQVEFLQDTEPIAGCESVPVVSGDAGEAIAECTTTALSIGEQLIVVRYTGSPVYAPAVMGYWHFVLQPPPAIVLRPSQSPAVFGTTVVFTATLSGGAGAPSGAVTFLDGPAVLCASVPVDAAQRAICATNVLTVGVHAITARYEPATTAYGAGTSPPLSIGIYVPSKPLPAMSIVPSQSPQVAGVPVTFTAILSGGAGLPTGAATFRDGGASIAACANVALDGSGRASCTTGTLTAGAHAITIAYSGDVNYAAGNSSALNINIYVPSGAAPAISLSPSQNPAIHATNVTLTATVSGATGTPTGAVVFRNNGVVIPACAAVLLQNGQARCTANGFAIGSHPITAQYMGNSVYGTVTSSPLSLGIYSNGKPVPTITVSPSRNPQQAGQPVTFTASLTGDSGPVTGTVIFLANQSTIGACAARPLTGGVATCTLSSLPVGTHSIMAIYSGSTSYNANTSVPFNQGIYP